MKKLLSSAFAPATLALCSLAALPAAGQDLAQIIKADVLPGWTLPDGRHVAGLRLQLEPGWKTYWRAPGDAGIPPYFDWSDARNIGEMSITWPQPVVFHDDGIRSIGYKDQVVIPLHISPQKDGAPVRLKGQMDLGVCADVCAPHTVYFDATLDGQSKTPTPSIASALASAPFSAKEAGVRSATCHITPLDDGLEIETRVSLPSAGAQEATVIEAGQPEIWVSEPQSHREGRELVSTARMVHSKSPSFSINRSDIRITVIGSSHSVDIKGCTAS